jgi:hypothetical protein
MATPARLHAPVSPYHSTMMYVYAVAGTPVANGRFFGAWSAWQPDELPFYLFIFRKIVRAIFCLMRMMKLDAPSSRLV